MNEQNFTASKLFGGANRFIEAYHRVLQPLCKSTGIPPMAVDILMFVANNPENSTARDICRYRGFKSGIVSVHIERLVTGGLLERRSVPNDRRKTLLVCTEKAEPIVKEGRKLQKFFAEELLSGLSDSETEVFRGCLAVLCDNIEKIRNGEILAKDR